MGLVLRAFLGDDSIPQPTELIRHKWTEVSKNRSHEELVNYLVSSISQDEFALGSYCHPNMGMEDEDELATLAEPLPSVECPRLCFAGEAFHPEHWSNLSGARFSGIREADRILESHKCKN